MKTKIWPLFNVIIVLESLVVMIGWIWGINRLTGVFNSEINMKFATALTFLLSAIALPFISDAIAGKKETAQVVLAFTTLLTFLIMVTLFVASFFNIQTGIENVFIQDVGSAKTLLPGMPAIPTMVAFIMFGIASIISLFKFEYARRIIVYLGGLVAFIGLVIVIGYVINMPALYFQLTANTTPVALNSGILLLLGLSLMNITMTAA
jgi:hypothetical protein